MKKIILLIVMMISILSLSMVLGVTIESNETTDVGTETFTATVVLNETSSYVLYIATDSGIVNIEQTITGTVNGTTNSEIVTGLTGGYGYYWQMNGTSEDTGDYSANSVEVVTDSYIIRGIARVIMGLFVFLVVAFTGIALIAANFTDSANPDVRNIMFAVIATLIGAMVVANFVVAVLGL